MSIEIKFYPLNQIREIQTDVEVALKETEGNSIFHSSFWLNLLVETFGIKGYLLLAYSNSQPIGVYNFYRKPLLGPLYMSQSPFSNLETVYGGPVVQPNHPEALTSLLHMSELLSRSAAFYIVTSPGVNFTSYIIAGYKKKEIYTSILSLGRSEEELWIGLHSKTRNMIRKAIKSGVIIRNGTIDDVPTYYHMLTEVFNRTGKQPLPEIFYRKVILDLAPKNMVRFLIAQFENRPIAGAIFLLYQDTAYYWSGASFIKDRNVAPNELIQWEFIRWANMQGFKKYDLLRVEPDRLPGIARFKMRFGGDTVPLYALTKWTKIGYIARMWNAIIHPRRLVNRIRKFIK